ncbi:MAG: helix-turn-helix transcriptional regulator [Clostridia bacterium]|nr:helix-turn-helix transcriptional regulator [Clostridia bacterium]
MKQITLTDLYTMRYITQLSAVTKEQWRDGFKWSFGDKRNGSVLLYVNACEIVYTFNNKILLTAKPGDFIYIPSDSRYTCTFKNCDTSAPYQGLKIDFLLYDIHGERLSFSDKITKLNAFFTSTTLHRMEELHRLHNMPEKPVTCACAKLELLIHEMALLEKQQGKGGPRFRGIVKGIEYMERDPDQDLSIAEVAAMCPASTSCFNRLFKEYSGMTPIEYRYAKKIEQAKALLALDEENVKSIAYALKFETPSYFCRMFKKKTGMTPKAYRDSLKKE